MINRILDPAPCATLAEYLEAGGGRALLEAGRIGPDATIGRLADAGLRGRGGAGFPTAVKWRTVADAGAAAVRTPVVVNAAEGEPGTFKDRTLLRRNPYKVIEGALIAAKTLGADEVIIAIKASFMQEIRRLRQAIAEIAAAPLTEGVSIRLAFGPDAYLFGEETALLEVIEHRQPFPRVTPPYRRGLDLNEADARRNASSVHLAVEGGSDEAPALVNNVETFANVPGIVAEGPEWFRSLGTAGSPGTILCTITGRTRRHGVAEFPMGTPLEEVIDQLGGGARGGHHLVAASSGVANPLLPASAFGTPLSHEAMAAVGSALGAAGFIVLDDTSDPVAVAHAMSRFLAVESCGQCEACKADGLAISSGLDRLRSGRGTTRDLDDVRVRVTTVTRGARCFLAHQQQRTIGSLLDLFGDSFEGRTTGEAAAAAEELIAPVVDIVDGVAVLDSESARKQPDWSYGTHDSGAWPAARLGNTPLRIRPRPHTVATPERAGDASGAAGDGDQDAFEQLRAVHAQLDELVDRLGRSDEPRRQDLLEEIEKALRVHEHITTGVLYPTLARAVPGLGDDAAWQAEHAIEAAERIAERMLVARRELSPGNVDALRDAIDEHIAHGEHFVIPLLENHLDGAQLGHLADSLALARSVEPSEQQVSTHTTA